MKQKFILSTIILLIGGFITKILALIIKIIMAKSLGIEKLSLYMLILPTFSLFINLGQIGLPIALSRLVALNNKNNKKLYLSIIPITLFINIIFSTLIIISSKYISINLLHNNKITLAIISIAFVIPFTSIADICRSYFFGKEKMLPHVLSIIIENIIRLLFMILILPKILFLNTEYIISILVLSNIISEIISTIILIIFIPKNISISLKDFKPNATYIKDSFKLGIPNVGSNIISNISYFLEPILLTNILLYLNYSNTYIIHEYGVITGYVIPMLLLPSFFTLAISQAIMPYITKEYLKNNKKNIINRLLILTTIIIIFGLITVFIFEFYGKDILYLLYKTTLGYNYLKVLAPFFILQYIQSIFTYTLNGMGKVKEIFKISIISSITRLLVILIISFLKIGIYSYIISIIINIIITSLYQIKKIFIYLK